MAKEFLVRIGEEKVDELKVFLSQKGCGYSEKKTFHEIVEEYGRCGQLIRDSASEFCVVYDTAIKQYRITRDNLPQVGTIFFTRSLAHEFCEKLNGTL